MQAREHRAEARVDRAVLRRPQRRGHRRLAGGTTRSARRWCATWCSATTPGRVYVVNPAADVGGRACRRTPTVGDIPDNVDVAIVAVPADAVQDVVLDCAAKGVHGLVVISSGFAETGEEGRLRQRRLVGLARCYGLRLVGPELPGHHQHRRRRLAERLAVAGDAAARPGRVLLPVRRARRRRSWRRWRAAGSGCPRSSAPATAPTCPATTCCSTGRRTTTTEVVLLYLESIGNPRKFCRIARRVSRRKPVDRGQVRAAPPRACRWATRCARSLAPQAAVDAMFRQAGVIQVDTLDEMFDVAQLLAHQPLPRGPPGRRGRQLRRARAARRRRRGRGRARGRPVGRARRRRHRRGLRGGPRRARSTTPRSTRWSRSSSRR